MGKKWSRVLRSFVLHILVCGVSFIIILGLFRSAEYLFFDREVFPTLLILLVMVGISLWNFGKDFYKIYKGESRK